MRWLWILAIGCHNPPGAQPGDFTDIAQNAGWTVQTGKVHFSTYERCCDVGANCLWNNPSTPYGTYMLPEGPGQPIEDDDIFASWGAGKDDLSRNFRLRADEAIVWIGRSPPSSKYWSLRTYVATQYDPAVAAGFDVVLGSLGPSLNHLVMAEQAGESVFDRDMAIVTSADAGVERAVRKLLKRSGIDPRWIFDDRISAAVTTMGLGAETDTLMTVIRFAVPDEEAAGWDYRADPGGTLLRLTPSTDLGAEPNGQLALPARGSGTDEEHLRDAVDALEAAILERYAEHTPYGEVAVPAWYEGYECIDAGACSGEIRDKFWSSVPPMLLANDASFAIVYGVNHERAGKASYANFSVDTLANLIGIDAVDSSRFAGSARAFIDHPDIDDLYVGAVARDCSAFEVPCVEIDASCPGADYDEEIKISFRAYLEPSTGAAPIAAEVVMDRAIKFAVEP